MEFKDYIESVLRGLVDEPNELSVVVTECSKNYVITVYLPSNNVGQIRGKQGRLQDCLSTIFRAASGALTDRVRGNIIEFVETDKKTV